MKILNFKFVLFGIIGVLLFSNPVWARSVLFNGKVIDESKNGIPNIIIEDFRGNKIVTNQEGGFTFEYPDFQDGDIWLEIYNQQIFYDDFPSEELVIRFNKEKMIANGFTPKPKSVITKNAFLENNAKTLIWFFMPTLLLLLFASFIWYLSIKFKK